MEMQFEWEEAKAANNLKKHRVSFETATRVFTDPFAMIQQDRIEDGDGPEVIRIISARCAGQKEVKRYEQNRSLQS